MMMTPLRAAACAALLVAPALHAQTEEAARTTTGTKRTFIPTGSSIVLRMDGPTALQNGFANTNFGRMLAGEEIGQMLEGFAPMLQAGLEEGVPPEIGDMLSMLGEQLLAYDGSMTISVRVSPALFQEDLSEPRPDAILPHVLVVASMTPNEGGDVTELANSFNDLLDSSNPPPLETLDVAGGIDAVISPEIDAGVVFPTVIDGSLFVAFGGDLENALKPLLEQREEMPLSTFGENASTSGFLGHFDLEFLGQAIVMAMEASGEADPMAMEIIPALGKVLGLSSLTKLNLRVRPAGEFIVSEIEMLRTPSEERGLMDLMLSNGRPKLVDWMLRDHPSAAVASFDMAGLPDMMSQVLGMLPPEAGVPPMEQIEGMVQQETGYDLRTQILGGFSGEFLVFDESLSAMADMLGEIEQGMEPDPEAALGYTFVIGLRDAPAFEKMVEDLLRKAGLHVQRSRVEYQGVNLSRFDLVGAMEFGFVDGAMVFGLGNRGTATMRRVIDRARAVKSGEASLDWPEEISKRLEVAGDDWSGLTIQRSGTIFDALAQFSQMAPELAAGDPEMQAMQPFLQILGAIGPLFEKYGVDTSVVTQTITPTRILSQAIN